MGGKEKKKNIKNNRKMTREMLWDKKKDKRMLGKEKKAQYAPSLVLDGRRDVHRSTQLAFFSVVYLVFR